MPTGPGGLDANGVWQYGEDDTEALASDLLNLGMSSISTEVGLLDAAVAAIVTGQILQVLSTTKTDTSSSTSGTYADVSGLSLAITPVSASSKILVIAAVILGHTIQNGGVTYAQVLRDSTAIGNLASVAFSMSYGAVATPNGAMWDFSPNSFNFLDSPGTTSETTYKVQFLRSNSTGTAYVNRSGYSAAQGGSSHLTLMEVAG